MAVHTTAPGLCAVLMLSGCGGPTATPVTQRSASGDLEGCYRVEIGAEARRRSAEPRSAFAEEGAYAQGAIYCLEGDRFHVKPPSGAWNTVLTQWSIESIWAPPARRVGVAWRSSPATRLHFDDRSQGDLTDLCRIDPAACPAGADIVPSVVEACPITFVRDGERHGLEARDHLMLVRLDPDATARARAEIAGLEPVEAVCDAAADALRAMARPSSATSRAVELDDPEGEGEGEEMPALPDFRNDVLGDRESCRAMLRAAAVSKERERIVVPTERRCEFAPRVACPRNAFWDGHTCVVRAELVCPGGSTRSGGVCVIDRVVSASEPPPPDDREAPPVPIDPAQEGTLDLNSIPASQVIVDGRPVGSTPLVGVRIGAGRHTIVFVHPELGKKVRTIELSRGQRVTVAVKF
jgi:hypothetical protein